MKNVRVNEQIKTKQCRLVGVDNEQLGIMLTSKAKEIAGKSSLDLVEIAPNSVPPVCKIMDYGKHKYEESKKESEAHKRQKTAEVREIRLRPDIQDNDLQVKLRQIKKFLADKNKVRIVIMFKGREISHGNLGWQLLEKIMSQLKDLALIQSQPRLEGNRMSLLLSPAKSLPQKKVEK